MKNNVLITGVTGQDGIFLCKELLNQNPKINIIGTSRNGVKNSQFFKRLNSLDNKIEISSKIKIVNIDFQNTIEINRLISEFKPDYIYNLMGPSSVYNSLVDSKSYFENLLSNSKNLLQACVNQNIFPSFFQASSSEMFAASEEPLTEKSKFSPRNPYSEVKLILHNEIVELRKEFDWNITSGIMFNHESHFRDNAFLFKKVINYANSKTNESLKIGSLELSRDWSHASEFVKAMILICNNSKSSSYIISSGRSNSIKDLLEIVFKYFNKDWKNFVEVDESLLRRSDPIYMKSNPKKINKDLNWKTKYSFEETVKKIINKN